MRKEVVLVGLFGGMLGLAACGDSGPQTAGGNAAPTGAGASNSNSNNGTFVNPTQAKTYAGVGSVQSMDYLTDSRVGAGQQAVTYAADQSTVRNSSISIAYDPTDATFTLKVTDPNGNVSTDTRFQDPASRTNFGGSLEPQWGTPQLANTNIRYLQAGDGDPLSPYRVSGSGLINLGNNTTPPDGDSGSSVTATTLFYEVPGSTTKYVTFAGFIRNSVTFSDLPVTAADGTITTYKQDHWHIERGAFAYGETTGNSAVPTTGTASYSGEMLATMVHNPTLDGANGPVLPTYFQWIEGTSNVNVDFAKSSVSVGLTGTVSAPQIDRYTAPPNITVPMGATFTAAGTGNIDLVNAGGFLGQFNSASFSATNNGAPKTVNIAGSSFNGAFYGPKADEVGGGFRIVGGNPDERIDILGAFTGKQH